MRCRAELPDLTSRDAQTLAGSAPSVYRTKDLRRRRQQQMSQAIEDFPEGPIVSPYER
jgi:hypothetical protein